MLSHLHLTCASFSRSQKEEALQVRVTKAIEVSEKEKVT